MASTEQPTKNTYKVLVPLDGIAAQPEEAEQALQKAMRENERKAQKYRPAIITQHELGKCLIFQIRQSDDERVQIAKYRIRGGIMLWLPKVVTNVNLADYAITDYLMNHLSAAQTLVSIPPYSTIVFKKVDQPIQHIVGGMMAAQATAPAEPEPEAVYERMKVVFV